MSSIPPEVFEYSMLQYLPIEDLYQNMKVDSRFSKVYHETIRRLLQSKAGLARVLSLGLTEHDYRLLDAVFQRVDLSRLREEMGNLVLSSIYSGDTTAIVNLWKNSEWFNGTPYISTPKQMLVRDAIIDAIQKISGDIDLKQESIIRNTLFDPSVVELLYYPMTEILSTHDPDLLLEILLRLDPSQIEARGYISGAYLRSTFNSPDPSTRLFLRHLGRTLANKQARDNIRKVMLVLDN